MLNPNLVNNSQQDSCLYPNEPRSHLGHNTILVAVDQFSKACRLIPLWLYFTRYFGPLDFQRTLCEAVGPNSLPMPGGSSATTLFYRPLSYFQASQPGNLPPITSPIVPHFAYVPCLPPQVCARSPKNDTMSSDPLPPLNIDDFLVYLMHTFMVSWHHRDQLQYR